MFLEYFIYELAVFNKIIHSSHEALKSQLFFPSPYEIEDHKT